MKKYPFPPKSIDYNELNEADFMNAGSVTDCTGLIPAEPVSEADYENYAELYDFLPHTASETVRPEY